MESSSGYADSEIQKMHFTAIIYNFFYRLSELSFISYPIDYHVDTFWAMMAPYQTDDDLEMWEELMAQSENTYQTMLAKIKALTILLYNNGVIRQFNIKHKHYNKYLADREGENTQETYIADQVLYENILTRHWLLLGMLTKKSMPSTMHVDVMWAYLTPYITEEDYVGAEKIANTFSNPDSIFNNPYQAQIDKVRLISKVADRANFALPHGMMDVTKDPLQKKWGDKFE